MKKEDKKPVEQHSQCKVKDGAKECEYAAEIVFLNIPMCAQHASKLAG